MNRILILILSTATLWLSGCVQREAYNRPAPPVPQAWPDSVGQAPDGLVPAATGWRDFFTDDNLRSIIELSLANNRDLRMAALNVEKVRTIYRIQGAELYPTLSAVGGREFARLPGRMSPTGESQISEQHVNLGAAAWELDLFGRIRNLKSQALEQYLASEQARAAAQIALVAAVADSYLALAAGRENLRLAEETLETQQATYELIRQTREAGMASDLELRQAESQVEAARADIARYSAQLSLYENALDLLAGTTVPRNLLPGELEPDRVLKEIAAGIPSEVLLRRPDILAAEHQLRAAYANIGAARAALFPRISLTAGLGFMSGDLSDLYKFGSRTWNFAPQAALPIFDPRVRRSVDLAKVDREAAVAEYEKAIQTAFREVSDALSLRGRLLEQERAQKALVDSLAETYRLSEARYKSGIDSYLNVLVAQRSLYGAQQGLIGLRLARLSNVITLYKVFGGGA